MVVQVNFSAYIEGDLFEDFCISILDHSIDDIIKWLKEYNIEFETKQYDASTICFSKETGKITLTITVSDSITSNNCILIVGKHKQLLKQFIFSTITNLIEEYSE